MKSVGFVQPSVYNRFTAGSSSIVTDEINEITVNSEIVENDCDDCVDEKRKHSKWKIYKKSKERKEQNGLNGKTAKQKSGKDENCSDIIKDNA